ncbi:hypothetical protein [Photobacterium atrarenae]|uniref:Nitrate/nitrite sensing protein domain-containing protein n=1 Tax=Photobacterium atrarenae TaxID=865757 RepID=A0ABY5GDM0_9GAMM|nr:hypothetical protein [Photobacterium atrarenae]UTV26814.1 hypothetical protein NNL38_10665 [Photobacterium atrarenae]
MLITTLFTILIIGLGYYSYRSRQTQALLASRFNQVIGLRQLIHLLRFHRRKTHQILSEGSNQSSDKLLNEALAIQSLLKALNNQAEQTQKPMYRILRKRTGILLDSWSGYSLKRNQSTHGKTIRHVLYLIDDSITQGLLAADQDQLFQQYQSAWSITLNAIDSLSRFRHAIHSFEPGSSKVQREMRLHIQILHRRLGQMAMMSSQAVPAVVLDTLFEKFDQINLQNQPPQAVKAELYQLSLQFSDTLFNLFDLVLADIGDAISIRLPQLPTDAINVIQLPHTALTGQHYSGDKPVS